MHEPACNDNTAGVSKHRCRSSPQRRCSTRENSLVREEGLVRLPTRGLRRPRCRLARLQRLPPRTFPWTSSFCSLSSEDDGLFSFNDQIRTLSWSSFLDPISA